MKNFILILIITGVSIFALQPAVAAANNPLGKATANLQNAMNKTGLESDLSSSVGTIVKGLLSLVGTIFLVLTIWAGILWMTAQGNDEKVVKAKGILETAVVGLFVVMAAYAITAFVTGRISSSSNGSSQVCSPGTCRDSCMAGETETYASDCTGTANKCCTTNL